MLTSARGGSKIGCLLALIIAGLAIYTAYQWGKAQWDYTAVKDVVWDAGKLAAATHGVSYAALKQNIINKAELEGIALYEDDVEISESQFSITIDVYWDTPIAFPGYTYYVEHHVSRTEQKTY